MKCPPPCAFTWPNAGDSVTAPKEGWQIWEENLTADGADLPTKTWLVSDVAAKMDNASSHIRVGPYFCIEHRIAT
eukprot:2120418-Pyramimonas_sp.AAC.1